MASQEITMGTVPNQDQSDDETLLQKVEEKKLVRKLHLYIIPLVTASYLVNIGNARLYGLEEDVNLSSEQFQVTASILFVTYLLFDVPSNLVLKLFTPRRWIAFIVTAWGIIATLTGLVESYGSLIACRLLLGVVEAGFSAMAGARGGLLAYGIGHMDGVRGMSGWRWIFIIEGIPSVVLGVVTLIALPNDAPSAYFLSQEEKPSSREFSRRDMTKAFTDWKVWAFSFAQFGVDTMLYGFSTFLPTIISALGEWTTAQVQLLTIPCYFLGAVAYMSIAVLSDRLRVGGVFCVIFGVISVIGYAVLLSDSSPGVHYFGCFLVAGGLYVVVGLPIAWLPNNTPRYGKRTTATGMQLTFGNASGIMSAFIYPALDKPRFIRGHAVSLSMVGLGTCVYAFPWFWFWRANKSRDAGELSEEHQGLPDDELRELGDDSPHFRYMI
ncbi:major facilitator superfamily domain-containing protein [Trichoderma compactum]